LAKLQYEQTARSAFADAANALVTRQKLGEVRVQQEREVSSYQEAVKVATQRYKAGQADYYELLQVQQELFPAEAALAQTRRDELISIVQLYKALGGGWNLKAPADWLGSP
jgi:outer membrane protein, multidrug efflux system